MAAAILERCPKASTEVVDFWLHEEPQPDPLTPDEVTTVLEKARLRFPEWYPFLLCGLRTGMRLGELLEVQWGDINWRSSYVEVRRAFVGGVVATPKNHQRRRVDLSRQLRAELRLWRRRERAAWLKKGRPAPPWVFASVSGTRLDPSNVRKAFDRVLTAAEVHHRGLHQLRHTCASLLLQHGAAITYVARQLATGMPRRRCASTPIGYQMIRARKWWICSI